MKRKFRVGDVVRYLPDTSLSLEFLRDFGRGPFLVDKLLNDASVYLTALDGSVLGRWTNHGEEYLKLDEFLTAVRRANNQTKKGDKTHEREDQKRRAVGGD